MVVIVIMLSVEALGLIVQVCFFGGLSLSVGVLVPFVIYSFFTNRNLEYHCIYTILYQLNSEIKEIINILNSYHYLTDEESLELYNMSFEKVYEKVNFVLGKIEKFLSLVL